MSFKETHNTLLEFVLVFNTFNLKLVSLWCCSLQLVRNEVVNADFADVDGASLVTAGERGCLSMVIRINCRCGV